MSAEVLQVEEGDDQLAFMLVVHTAVLTQYVRVSSYLDGTTTSSKQKGEAQLRQKEDLGKRIIGQECPWMGDCASTWDNAVDTVMRDVGEGFKLRRHNKENLFTKAQEGTRFAENRPCRMVVSCLQAGKSSNNLLAKDIQKRRNTFSKKIGCQGGVTMQWPQKLNGPKITQAFLAHLTPGSGRQEHPCPRKFDNKVTMAEIDDQEEMVRDLHEARVGTKEIYKGMEKDGKVLGEEGKSKASMGFVVCVGVCRRCDPSSLSYLSRVCVEYCPILKKKRG
eukprot:jgi/Undpi1/7822/HiC_scaffold_23.g10295.m1